MKLRAEFRPHGTDDVIPVRFISYDEKRNRIVVVIDHECHTEIRVLQRYNTSTWVPG